MNKRGILQLNPMTRRNNREETRCAAKNHEQNSRDSISARGRERAGKPQEERQPEDAKSDRGAVVDPRVSSDTQLADEMRNRLVPGSDQAGDRDSGDEHDRRRHARDGRREPHLQSRTRYGLAALASAATAGLFVYFIRRRTDQHQRVLTRANLLTLSRVAGASLLAGTAAAPRLGRRAAMLALIWGGPSDWLDGPLARRDGPTALGALLDIEADSWLTLWAAIVTWRTGALPRISLLPPIVRYAIPVLQARRKCARPRDRVWQRAAAGLQTMTLFLALAPARRLQRVARASAPIGAIAQSAAMAFTVRDLFPATLD